MENLATTAKKRGSPEGKPRKQPPHPGFDFMRLPLELRRHFYGLVLPQQDVQRSSGQWANIVRTPNEFMNLLLVNKQIHDEAQRVLYGLNSFTWIVEADWHFTTTRAARGYSHIKHWQLVLRPEPERELEPHFRDGVLTSCAEIAKTPDLQTLKLVIPCLCQHVERHRHCSVGAGGRQCINVEDMHNFFVHGLAPLDQLRFKRDVQIIAAVGPPVDRPQQCQKPLCVSFVDSFESIRARLMGNSTPSRLTENQSRWLELKKWAAKVHPTCCPVNMYCPLLMALRDAWGALDARSDEDFRKMCDGLLKALRRPMSLREG